MLHSVSVARTPGQTAAWSRRYSGRSSASILITLPWRLMRPPRARWAEPPGRARPVERLDDLERAEVVTGARFGLAPVGDRREQRPDRPDERVGDPPRGHRVRQPSVGRERPAPHLESVGPAARVVVVEPEGAPDRPVRAVDLEFGAVGARHVLVVDVDDRADVAGVDEDARRARLTARRLAGPSRACVPKTRTGSPRIDRIASK